MQRRTHQTSEGFTLIEMAMVVAIVSLLISGMVIPLATRFEQQAYSDTQARLDNATQALIGYAVLNGRLPCPSATVDGLELTRTNGGANPLLCGTAANSDTSSVATNTSWGDFPWGTLGIAPPNNADAWNYRLRYAVCTKLVENNSLNTANINGCAITVIDNITPATPITLVNNASFVVYSHGKNSWGGSSIGNATYTSIANPTSADELANLPSTEVTPALRGSFISRTRTGSPPPPATTPLEFDDLLTWMSPNTLTAKLVAAGVWTP